LSKPWKLANSLNSLLELIVAYFCCWICWSLVHLTLRGGVVSVASDLYLVFCGSLCFLEQETLPSLLSTGWSE